MNLRDAAQQALEVIGWLRLHLQRDHQCLHMDSTGSGIPAWIAKSQTAIRAALAEPQPEPVAWMVYTEGGTSAYVTDNPNDLVGAYRALPLYTTPPQRQPLTIDEVEQIRAQHDHEIHGDRVMYIVRMTEKAHGIGGDK